jgi:hypothetical protein
VSAILEKAEEGPLSIADYEICAGLEQTTVYIRRYPKHPFDEEGKLVIFENQYPYKAECYTYAPWTDLPECHPLKILYFRNALKYYPHLYKVRPLYFEETINPDIYVPDKQYFAFASTRLPLGIPCDETDKLVDKEEPEADEELYRLYHIAHNTNYWNWGRYAHTLDDAAHLRLAARIVQEGHGLILHLEAIQLALHWVKYEINEPGILRRRIDSRVFDRKEQQRKGNHIEKNRIHIESLALLTKDQLKTGLELHRHLDQGLKEIIYTLARAKQDGFDTDDAKAITYKVVDDKKTYREAVELQKEENNRWEPTPAEKKATEDWRNEYLSPYDLPPNPAFSPDSRPATPIPETPPNSPKNALGLLFDEETVIIASDSQCLD